MIFCGSVTQVNNGGQSHSAMVNRNCLEQRRLPAGVVPSNVTIVIVVIVIIIIIFVIFRTN